MRKKVRYGFLKAILFIVCSGYSFFNKAQAQQLSGSYTIDAAHPTQNRNFQSFLEATLALKNGITGPVVFDVALNSGPYNEQVTIDSVVGASVTNTVTFNGNGNELFFTSTNSSNRAGIRIDGADHIIFDSLKITVQSTLATEFGYGVQILRNADNNIIRKCTIVNPLYTEANQTNEGIIINGTDDATEPGLSYCDNNLITQNTIIGGWRGVALSSVFYTDPIIRMHNNKITYNIIKDFQSQGIDLTFTSGTLIEGNDISGRVTFHVSKGIGLGDNNEKCIIRGNRIHNVYDDPALAGQGHHLDFEGIMIAVSPTQAGSENLVINNAIYDFRNTGNQTGINVWLVSGINIYHNTISLQDNNPASDGSTTGFQIESSGSNINFINNIITINRGGNVSNRALEIDGATKGFLSDRNDILVGTAGSSNSFGRFNATYADLTAWQVGTQFDLHSAALDPRYTDLANGNLAPSDSAIDNMGIYLNINTDILGAVRNNTHPDIGAFEFLTPPCIAPIEGGDMKVLPGLTVCESSNVVLNLQNNTFGTTQTYTWQSADAAAGPFTSISNALVFPAHDIVPVATKFYRAMLTCGTITAYSDTVQIVVSPRLPAGTYTINSAQATGGSNFTSYTDALNAIHCGIRGAVTFNVTAGSGPYNEQLIINPIPGSSITNTVTFNGNGTTLTYLSTNTNERATVKLNGASNFIFDNIKIEAQGAGSGQYGFGVQLLNDADNNTIKNCTVTANITGTGSEAAGIVIGARRNDPVNLNDPSYCDSNTVQGNTIIGGLVGVSVISDPADSMIYKNRVLNNIIKDQRQYGIFINGTVNTVVEGNDISRPTRTNPGEFSGIYMARGNENLLISKNKLHNPFDGNLNATSTAYGINITSSDAAANTPVTISNNLIYNFNGKGTQYGLYNSNADNVRYYYNTVSLEDSTATGITNATRAFYQTGTATGIEVKNNNFVISRGGTGQMHALYMNASGTGYTANYNNYYLKGTNPSTWVVRHNATNYKTLAEWKAAGNTDSVSISLDPLYKDAANADYTPNVLDLDNKGVVITGITTDLNNKTRSATTPDIGAYEFSMCIAFTTAPQISVDSTGTRAIKFTWTAVPGATGYEVSRDGLNFTAVSGLAYTIAGLNPKDTAGLVVKALGFAGCPSITSDRVVGTTLEFPFTFPNTFTPNGNGQNDYFRVKSPAIQSIRMMIFNQWGEKVFETTSLMPGWDGTYKGKQQPVGVYVYVAKVTLTDGTVETAKGTFNLIR